MLSHEKAHGEEEFFKSKLWTLPSYQIQGLIDLV